jgi:hypothetical protein
MLTLFHAETGVEVDLTVEGSLLDKLLKCLDYVIGTFDMAGTADTDA